MEKHPRASNSRKQLPPVDLKVKERKCYWNPDRATYRNSYICERGLPDRSYGFKGREARE